MAEISCDDGILLKWGGEQTVRPLRIVVYMLLLGWCFMGVAIIADVFMVAIEKITSRKTRRYIEKTKRYATVTVWNPTVANLTLMALGSSAPEILINVIEIFRDDFFNGPAGVTPLGPSVIVGSAAFNLFIIIAVCVCVIPSGEVRTIKELPVYALTAVCSILAYAWLIVVLLLRSPHAVEVWEGVLTFLFFPILVAGAFCLDKGCYWFKSGEETCPEGVVAAEMTKEELAELENRIRKEHGADLSEDQVAKFVQIHCGESSSRAKYRIAATRAIVGGKRVRVSTAEAMGRSFSGLARLARSMASNSKKVAPLEAQTVVPTESGKAPSSISMKDDPKNVIIEFSEIKKAVLENAGFVSVVVWRSGDLVSACSVDYTTRDGTAHSPNDYMQAEGTLHFGPYETTKTIEVSIVDDFSYEENEEFYIDLSNACVLLMQDDTPGSPPTSTYVGVELGENGTITVVIVDDDLPGIIAFPEDEVRVAEKVVDYEVPLVVMRKNGSTGKVSCHFRTEDDTAIAGTDYEAQEGTLEFQNQEMEHTVRVKIKARGRYERSEQFRVILEGPIKGGAKFDPETDGGPDCCILTVIVECEKVAKDRVDRLMNTMQTNWDKAKVGHSNWRDQFVAALYVNGGEEGGDGEVEESPSAMDYAMHVITVPWKVLFAFCPPPDYCGGWLSFYVALGFIGFVTALITDLANLLGCSLDICNAITAITFVALGTSLPDAFASKTAATQDPFADASIVNVTGSNSVNVFLGFGLPWTLASAKWAFSGRNAEWDARYSSDEDIAPEIRMGHGLFIVKAGDLGFSVGVFTTAAFICIAILALRRHNLGGELGGPSTWKYLTSAVLVLLWLAYVGLSSWKAMLGNC